MPDHRNTARTLAQALTQRLLVLDGATGTMQQAYELTERDYRGDRFAGHNLPLKGNGDVLSLTRPDIVEATHRAYLQAGADIICTNTFGGTRIVLSEYSLEHQVHAINAEAARLARQRQLRSRPPGPGTPDRACPLLRRRPRS